MSAPERESTHWFYPLMLGLCLLIMAGASLILGQRMPHGLIDAVTMWNLHAKFLALGEAYWRWDSIRELPWWFHGDYPLLLSSIVARSWQVSSGFSTLAPQLVQGLASFGTISLLYGALRKLGGNLQAWFGAMALTASSYFFFTAMLQVADILVGFYLLSAVTLLFSAFPDSEADHGKPDGKLLGLAGFLFACAGWTKNDGLLHIGALTVSLLLMTVVKSRFRLPVKAFLMVLAGMTPVLLTLAHFKAEAVIPSDLLVGTPADFWHRLTDSRRTGLILKNFFIQGLTAGGLVINPGTLALFGRRIGWTGSKHGAAFRLTGLFLLLSVIGLALVYQLSPYDTAWHLKTSLPRLLLQLWPVYIFWISVNLNPSGKADPLRNEGTTSQQNAENLPA